MLAIDPRRDQDRTPMELSTREREVLDFERSCWQRSGPKETAIREHLRMSSTRYYELLNELLDEPAALSYDPLTVKRARRLRDDRRRARLEGRRAK
jgi:hypothetical protein